MGLLILVGSVLWALFGIRYISGMYWVPEYESMPRRHGLGGRLEPHYTRQAVGVHWQSVKQPARPVNQAS